jgi:uncharacterized hydrophobic protein (TIGR00271 family)
MTRAPPDTSPMQDGTMLHIRVVTPHALCDQVLALLEAEPSIHNIVVMKGACRRPDGDLIQFDVPREGANAAIVDLRSLDIHRCGSIAIERVDTALSDIAAAAEARSPGESSEAVIWEEVESRVRDESALTVSYLAMMIIAVLLGAVGIMLDSPVLIVGAMVVGPDYGPLAGVALGLHRRRIDRAFTALRTLTIGFISGILCAAVLTLIVRLLDWIPAVYKTDRPLTSFISSPDGWAVLVALLAGVAGILALTESKSGTLVGVLISVTTIPAASNIGVALAMARWAELGGAAAQLLVNIAVMCIVGLITLTIVQSASGSPIRSTVK